MKRTQQALRLFFASILTICTFQSCALFREITVVEDEVYASKRIRANFEYRATKEPNSPLIWLSQTIIKESKPDSAEHYRSYEQIRLKSNSFKLDNKTFILIDRTAFQVQLESVEFEKMSSIQEKRKDVITADSTKISVVTGYENNQSNDYKIAYSIEPEMIEKIKTAQRIRFRHYAGPDMMTVTMSKHELNVLKKLIATK